MLLWFVDTQYCEKNNTMNRDIIAVRIVYSSITVVCSHIFMTLCFFHIIKTFHFFMFYLQ